MTLFDEPGGDWGQTAPLDPFTTVWRGRSRGNRNLANGKRKGIYHLNPHCPLLGLTILKSRLGSVQAQGMVLCSMEADPFNWNNGTDQARVRNEGRLRALAMLEVKT